MLAESGQGAAEAVGLLFFAWVWKHVQEGECRYEASEYYYQALEELMLVYSEEYGERCVDD